MAKLLLSSIFLVVFITLCAAKSLRDLSAEEFHSLKKSTVQNFVAVYFDKKVARQKHPNFLKEYRKAASYLEAHGIELAKVDCDSVLLKEECDGLAIYTYRDGIFEESVDLAALFSVDSIVANFLQILLKDEIGYIYDATYAEDTLQANRGKKNVIFVYIKGFGTKGHRIVTELAFVYGANATFALTTDKDVAKQQIDGFADDRKVALVAHLCKKADPNTKEPCEIIPYSNKFRIIQIAQFIELINHPRMVKLPKDGKTPFDNTTMAVNKLYVFVDTSLKHSWTPKDVDNKLAKYLWGTVGVVFVDVIAHANKLARFGLSRSTLFPTGAFIPYTSRINMKDEAVELFPENTLECSLSSLKNFALDILQNPREEYKTIAESLALRVLLLNEFKRGVVDELAPYSTDYVIVGQCEHGNPDAKCPGFAKNIRRLARTIHRQVMDLLTLVYVQVTGEEIKSEFDGVLPTLRLYSRKGDLYKHTADHTEPLPSYDEMLKFVRHHTKDNTIIAVPPSNSDQLPIAVRSASKGSKKKKDAEDSEKAEDELDGEDEKDGEDEEQDANSTPPEEIEDDEVAGAVWYSNPIKVPEDKVPSLTDKTFTPSQSQHDLLMVNFFQPWDPRSKAIVEPYLDAALNLGKIDIGNFDVQLARVNCFDWTDVCQKNNITIYPTIKLYRKGLDEQIYNGPLDADHFVKAVLLLQQPSPLKLASSEEIHSFLKGELPKNAAQASPVSVLGLFANEDTPEFKLFQAIGEKLRGHYLLGSMAGESAKVEAQSHGLQIPTIVAMKRNDPLSQRVVFNRPYTEANLLQFVRLSGLQSFGELKPINLPLYYEHRRPLLIEFRASEAAYAPVMQQIAADYSLPNVFLCWMPISNNDVNSAILESYTGEKQGPALVLVDHSKAAVYVYKGTVGDKKAIVEWVNSCITDDQLPSSKLKEKKWEPLLEGYDYLKMIDEEEKKKKEKKKKEEEEEEDGKSEEHHVPEHKRDRLRQRLPEDFRKKEEEDDDHPHDEL